MAKPKRRRSTKIRRRRLDVQEINFPTVEVSVDDPEATRAVRRNLTRVRQSEAWRHNQLTAMQRQAEQEIHQGWRSIVGGALQAINWARGGRGVGTGNEIERRADLELTWWRWRTRARAQKILLGAFLDVLNQPKTLAEIDHDRRKRSGFAMSNYIRGLDLWCELRGWARPGYPQRHVSPTT